MSGGKGSKPAGNVTTTNLTGQKQEPYLEELWKGGQNLYNQYTPGSLTATQGNPMLAFGLKNLGDASRMTSEEWQGRVYEPWLSTAGQKYTDSPAYNYYQQFAQNQTGPQQQLQGMGDQALAAGQNYANQIAGYAPQLADWARQAGANNNLGFSTLGQIAQGQGTGMQQLGQTASGAYLNSNPYLDKMVQSAMDPITRNFQTAVDPSTQAKYAASGRYGSGAMLGERQNNANTLATQLGNVSNQMYGQNYAQERQNQVNAANQYAGLQNQAGSNYGQLYNQGMQTGMQGLGAASQAQQAAANTMQQGINQALQTINPQLSGMLSGAQGLQGGYQNANQNVLSAATLYPQLQTAAFAPSLAQQQAGQGFNAMQQQLIDEPYTALQRYQGTIGQPIGAGTSQPYFQNGMANTMAGITGGLDIMSKMGGMLGKI